MNGHNPDILTCLANLSADEVFTPPKLASAMLDILPRDLFHRPDTTFLDPVCKSGVFLREIARRLNDGLKDQMPDDRRSPRQQVRSLRQPCRLAPPRQLGPTQMNRAGVRSGRASTIGRPETKLGSIHDGATEHGCIQQH